MDTHWKSGCLIIHTFSAGHWISCWHTQSWIPMPHSNMDLCALKDMSLLQWVSQLQAAGEILAFKSQPVLLVQRYHQPTQSQQGLPYQKEIFKQYSRLVMGIDTTQNTTHYEKIILFTAIIRDLRSEKIIYFRATKVWPIIAMHRMPDSLDTFIKCHNSYHQFLFRHTLRIQSGGLFQQRSCLISTRHISTEYSKTT